MALPQQLSGQIGDTNFKTSDGQNSYDIEHNVDWKTDDGSIRSPIDGKVIAITGTSENTYPKLSYGKRIQVQDENGITHIFSHAGDINAKVGDTVKVGDKLGMMGTSGNVAPGDSHIDYEVWKDKDKLNARDFLGQHSGTQTQQPQEQQNPQQQQLLSSLLRDSLPPELQQTIYQAQNPLASLINQQQQPTQNVPSPEDINKQRMLQWEQQDQQQQS
jgi:murein DD-endopeptidase MepM/ murein hydrolase activator NlpD